MTNKWEFRGSELGVELTISIDIETENKMRIIFNTKSLKNGVWHCVYWQYCSGSIDQLSVWSILWL